MSQDTIRVSGATADRNHVTLYLEDGTTVILNQGDHRLKDLLDAIIPITSKGGVAVVSLNEFSVYSAFEKESSGLVRMFKVAKSRLGRFFSGSDEPVKEEEPKGKKVAAISQETVTTIRNSINPQNIPTKDDGYYNPTPVDITEEKPSYRSEAAQINHPNNPHNPISTFEDKVKENLTPMNGSDTIGEDETVVAVIGETIIPGIEKIRHLIEHAVKNNSRISVENFLKRIAAIIDERRHSVEDVLRFLEKGDLPLAEDGSIIAYKVLRRSGDKYVDCHTGRVTQQIGSYVCVEESLVDLKRDNECSNGLHIARRSYLSFFNGDVCVLAKIDPEDVMTVPHRDPNKVRVKGYHILAELSKEAWALLKSNKPMTGEESALKVVYEAIKGHHIGRIEQVKIHAQKGNDVRITPLFGSDNRKSEEVNAEDLKRASAVDDPNSQVTNNVSETAEPINIRDLNKQINNSLEQSEESVEEKLESDELEEELAEQVVETMEKEILDAVETPAERVEQMDPTPLPEEVREDNRVTEEILTLDAEGMEAVSEMHDKLVKSPKLQKAITPAVAEKAARKEREREKKAAKALAKAEADRIAEQAKKDEAARPKRTKASNPVKDQKADEFFAKPKTKAEQARYLYEIEDYKSLKTLKKQSKKSWDALGISLSEVENMDK